jgi:hypothetical protein
VPLYNGSNAYIISMGAFSIISGLSESVKLRNQSVIKRCFNRIGELLMGGDSDMRAGIFLLAL